MPQIFFSVSCLCRVSAVCAVRAGSALFAQDQRFSFVVAQAFLCCSAGGDPSFSDVLRSQPQYFTVIDCLRIPCLLRLSFSSNLLPIVCCWRCLFCPFRLFFPCTFATLSNRFTFALRRLRLRRRLFKSCLVILLCVQFPLRQLACPSSYDCLC